MKSMFLLILFCFAINFLTFSVYSQTNREKAIWAIASVASEVEKLKKEIDTRLTDAIFAIDALKGDQDLTDAQLTKIKTIVNRIKTTLFNIPTCVELQNYKDMEKDNFNKGQAALATATKQ